MCSRIVQQQYAAALCTPRVHFQCAVASAAAGSIWPTFDPLVTSIHAMKPAETALSVCVVGLACFIGGQIIGIHNARLDQTSAGAIGERLARAGDSANADLADFDESFGTARPELRLSTSTPVKAATMTLNEVKRRLVDGQDGTYINELIASRDSAIVRWPDRVTRPLRIWVAEDEQLATWNSDYVPAVRDAFDAWAQTGIPVRFTYVIDSASADVHVKFVDKFPNGISGKTVWSRDSAWWLVSSDIQLGLAHPSGGAVTPPQMRAIALHEVGHLLGLDHAHAADNIMSARIRVRELTEADRATVRLLYTVPAGIISGESH